jgi:ABC-type protease/lipase transport system fused ATPase/permease subunit
VDDAYDELAAYTLTRGDASFVHQHVVDVRAIKTATAETRSIAVVQSLVGHYLHAEHGFDGRQVQRVHKVLADQRPEWPAFELPEDRGSTTVDDILAVHPATNATTRSGDGHARPGRRAE